jgi:hypothetical protein
MTDSIHHGFKQITVSNWKEMDDIIQFPSPVRDETWLKACLKPQLKTDVPNEVVAMYEVARGSMIYGWFFYPLITLATEQFHRVQETAAREKCRHLGIAPAKFTKKGTLLEPKHSEVIEALVRHGTIKKSDEVRWHAARRLRNSSSHPQHQSILLPGMSLGVLKSTTELINKLFQ